MEYGILTKKHNFLWFARAQPQYIVSHLQEVEVSALDDSLGRPHGILDVLSFVRSEFCPDWTE